MEKINEYHKHACELTESQQCLLFELSDKSDTYEFMPFRNVNDADRLFDLMWLNQIKFINVTVEENEPRKKLAFRLSLVGLYARGILLRGGVARANG